MLITIDTETAKTIASVIRPTRIFLPLLRRRFFNAFFIKYIGSSPYRLCNRMVLYRVSVLPFWLYELLSIKKVTVFL